MKDRLRKRRQQTVWYWPNGWMRAYYCKYVQYRKRNRRKPVYEEETDEPDAPMFTQVAE